MDQSGREIYTGGISMKKITVWRNLTVLLIVAALLTSTANIANADDKASVAMVTSVKKELKVTHNGKDIKGVVGMDLYEGDILKTGPGCQAVMMMGDGSEIKLNEKTEITIKAYNNSAKSIFIKIGEIFGKFLPQKTKVMLETPKGVAGIEGTEVTLKVDEQDSEVNVNEGTVKVGTTDIGKGKAFKMGGKKFMGAGSTAPPQWAVELKDYFTELKDIGDGIGKIKLQEIARFTDTEFQESIKNRGEADTKLRELKPPTELNTFHSQLITLNKDTMNCLETGRKLKQNPRNPSMKAELKKQIRTIQSEYLALVKEIKSQSSAWGEKKTLFKSKYEEWLKNKKNTP